jgi:hypothetical protein
LFFLESFGFGVKDHVAGDGELFVKMSGAISEGNLAGLGYFLT